MKSAEDNSSPGSDEGREFLRRHLAGCSPGSKCPVQMPTGPPSVDTFLSLCIPIADSKFLKTLCLLQSRDFGEPSAPQD
jgi:hypothetical protein